VFSAIDAIKVYETYFSAPLHGATSSLISAVFGLPRINLENMIFAYEWGQNSGGTGSANSVYLTEAYVNFGWTGVVIFSAITGLCFSVFAKSRDEALRAIWPLFCMNLFVAPLSGTLFSNGFLVIFVMALAVRMRGIPLLPPQTKRQRRRARSIPVAGVEPRHLDQIRPAHRQVM
jgi:hypothetical protein